MKPPIVTEKNTIHTIKGAISNIYLLESRGGLLLIDPGVAGDIFAVSNYMKKHLKKDISDVKLIVVTHMHPDHSGGASEIRRRYSIPIASHHRTGKWYKGLGGHLQYYFDRLMTVGVAVRQEQAIGSVRFERILEPEYPLIGGEVLPFFEEWETVYVPGHTTHDIVVYNKKEKILFAGDMVICVRNDNFDIPMPIIFKKRIRTSYDALSELDIDIICPGHGHPFRPENSAALFVDLKHRTYNPLTTLSKKVHMLSFYSPEVRNTCLKDLFVRLHNLRKSIFL